MRRTSILLFLFFLICQSGFTKNETLYAYRNVIPDGYNFFIRVPSDTTEGEKLPVVLFLHGKSLSGNDLNSVLRYGSLDAIRRGVKISAIVVAPQTDIPSWDAEKLDKVLEYVLKKFNADRNRVYVVGMSMGGWGALKVAQAYPKKIAAAVAMCGGYTQSSVNGLLQVPLWIIHGTQDDVTPCSYSIHLVKTMSNTGKADRLLFDFLPCDHSILARVFYLDALYKWLYKHSLTDKNRPANRDVQITMEMINNAYSYIKSGPVTFNIEEGR